MTETTNEQPPADPGPQLNRDRLRNLDELRLSSTDRYIAGVAGGLGRHFGVDPLVVRVVLVALAFFGGAGVLLYGACWLFVPQDATNRAIVDLNPHTRRLILLIVGAIAALSTLSVFFGPGHFFVWPLGLVVIGCALVLAYMRPGQHRPVDPADPSGPSDTTATAAAPRPRRPARTGTILFWPTIATIIAAWGLLGIFGVGHHINPSVWPATALGIVGIALLIGAFVGRPGGLILIGLLLLPPLAATSAVGSTTWHWERSDATIVPASAAAVGDYRMTNGQLILDLSQVADPQALAGRTMTIDMTAGNVEITLPRGIATDLETDLAVAGDVEVNGSQHAGWNPKVHQIVGTGGTSPFHLNINGRVGRVIVTSPLALTPAA